MLDLRDALCCMQKWTLSVTMATIVHTCKLAKLCLFTMTIDNIVAIFVSLEFGTKFQKEIYLFWEIIEFPGTPTEFFWDSLDQNLCAKNTSVHSAVFRYFCM